jgi:hypothetical protein
MADIATSIYAAVQQAVDGVIDSIAVEGVAVLTQVLENEGFSQFEYLKNYRVYAHVKDDEIWFEIILNMESLDDESKAEVLDKDAGKEDLPPQNARVFTRNEFGRVSRIIPIADKRKPARDARTDALRAPKHLHDTRVKAEDRHEEHEIAAHAPRSLLLNNQGQVSIIMKGMVSKNNDTFTYRHKKFEGAIGRFVDKLSNVVVEKFSEELQKIMGRYLA